MLMEVYLIRLLRKILFPQIEGSMSKECGKIKNPPLLTMLVIVLMGVAETVTTAVGKTLPTPIFLISQGVLL